MRQRRLTRRPRPASGADLRSRSIPRTRTRRPASHLPWSATSCLGPPEPAVRTRGVPCAGPGLCPAGGPTGRRDSGNFGESEPDRVRQHRGGESARRGAGCGARSNARALDGSQAHCSITPGRAVSLLRRRQGFLPGSSEDGHGRWGGGGDAGCATDRVRLCVRRTRRPAALRGPVENHDCPQNFAGLRVF